MAGAAWPRWSIISTETKMIKQHIALSIETLKQLKRYAWIAVCLFAIGVALGFIFHSTIFPIILPELQALIAEIQGASHLEIIAFIYGNNLTASFIAIMGGIFYGIFPAISALLNGVIIGAVLKQKMLMLGSSHWWQLIPHGIFELPAFFLALSLGMFLGNALLAPDKITSLKQRSLACFTTYMLWIVPTLLVAAIIEGTLIALDNTQ